METLGGSTKQRQEIINIGKEFAFEGLEMSYFKANSAEELRLFKQGYEEGLKIIQGSEKDKKETESVKKVA